MNVDTMKRLRDTVAARTDLPFNMQFSNSCLIMYTEVANDATTGFYGLAGAILGLNEDQSRELFYAGSIPSSVRGLETFTREEALKVLDRAIELENVPVGLWRDTMDDAEVKAWMDWCDK